MTGFLDSLEVLLAILLAFAFGIGTGYAAISAILLSFRPKAPVAAMPLEPVGVARH